MNKFLTSLPLLFACFALQAAPIQIIDLPLEGASSGFAHNNFHDTTLVGGADGNKLAWFFLGNGFSSYDPVTGVLILNIQLVSPDDFVTNFGTAVGTGNLVETEFNGHDGGLIGSISWEFDALALSKGLANTTTVFADINYATSALGYTPNSYFANDYMALWGADCDLDVTVGGDGLCNDFPSLGIGVDFVATFVPVPAAVWLFGSGLIALVGVSRRKSRQS